MTLALNYNSVGTFVKVSASNSGYANKKTPLQQIAVNCIFLENAGYQRNNNQDSIDTDAIVYPDITNSFILANLNQLEGLYFIAPFAENDESNGWYKVENAIISRDHLLDNVIDNIELQLKKSTPIAGVS